ncbi:cation acetate symporter [Longispora albida]|uniref:sodium/solute symporter n=1 Tax=Longispora albida TaxID=203523 RepID=UPI00058D81E5|nr:cation acetate symporter [Longispora albida]
MGGARVSWALAGIVLVTLVTLVIGFYGLRVARTTSDLLVASRSVSPRWNAAAIGGEYLSAASFLGIAGLVLSYGLDVLWYPIGFAAGYLALLLFVAGPLRRSGAFTLPDFCELRLGSRKLRRLVTAFVVFIGWLYLLPQLQGAGLTLRTVTGAPYWAGVVLVAAVVTGSVALGGMRSITFVQAFQYWLKLTALAVPVVFLLLRWRSSGSGALVTPESPVGTEWLLGGGTPAQGLFGTYSLLIATFLGTMGLPHVLVRFYTNPDGRAARRTTLGVLGLVGVFYLFPTIYGLLGRIYTPGLATPDAVVLVLPGVVLGDGPLGQALGALVAAGAFAAFLSTSSGLLTSVAGVLSTDVLGRGSVRDFRWSAVIAGLVPAVLALSVDGVDVSRVVGLAFAVAAATFCPLLLLGIWWRGLTDAGAAAGMIAGGGAAAGAVVFTVFGDPGHGWLAVLVTQPAAWTVPMAFAVMVLVSLATRRRVPAAVGRMLLRLHAPESLV